MTVKPPVYVHEYLITCCAFGDEDKVPTCLYAAIQVPADVPHREVPKHVIELMQQITHEMPDHLTEPYGRRPNLEDLFWECAPNPQELNAGAVVVPWITPV